MAYECFMFLLCLGKCVLSKQILLNMDRKKTGVSAIYRYYCYSAAFMLQVYSYLYLYFSFIYSGICQEYVQVIFKKKKRSTIIT